MPRISKSFHALVFGGALLVGGPLVESPGAQEGGPPIQANQRSRSSGSIHALTGRVARSIVPDRAVHPTVTKLAIHLGTIPLGGNQRAFGTFYEFSTMQIPRANGFNITTGIT
jgi:hypothetical protein